MWYFLKCEQIRAKFTVNSQVFLGKTNKSISDKMLFCLIVILNLLCLECKTNWKIEKKLYPHTEEKITKMRCNILYYY